MSFLINISTIIEYKYNSYDCYYLHFCTLSLDTLGPPPEIYNFNNRCVFIGVFNIFLNW